MFDVATLGLAVNSGQVSQATPELNKLAAAANTAEAAADRLKATTSAGATAQTSATAATKMHTAALQAQAAAARITANTQRMLGFQINDIVVSLASGMNPAMVALQQGSQIAQMGLREVAGAALGMARSFAPVLAIVGLASAAIAGMTAEINKTSSVTVEFGDVALATWQVVAGGIYSVVQPAIGSLVKWMGGLWEYIKPGIIAAGNGIVGAFVFAYDAAVLSWQLLPNALGDVTIQTANAVIGGVQEMVNGAISLLNGFVDSANGLLPDGFKMDKIGGVKFGGIDNPFSGFADEFGMEMQIAAEQIGAIDYMGALFGAISRQSQTNALARLAADAEDAKGKVKALRTDGMEPLVGSLTTFGNAVKDAFSNLGTGIIDAFTKGGNVAQNFFSLILNKIGQVGESLLNTGLNSLLNIGLGSLFGAPTGGVMGNGLWGSAIFSAKGNVFSSPSLSAYSGQIVNQPTMFAFAKGAGVMGEAGPEAIMPLRRTPDGRLGVAAMNDNGGGSMGDLIVNLTVQAPAGGTEADGAAYGSGLARELNRLLPDAIEQYNRNPRRRRA